MRYEMRGGRTRREKSTMDRRAPDNRGRQARAELSNEVAVDEAPHGGCWKGFAFVPGFLVLEWLSGSGGWRGDKGLKREGGLSKAL